MYRYFGAVAVPEVLYWKLDVRNSKWIKQPWPERTAASEKLARNFSLTAASVDRSINVVPVEHRQPFFLPVVGGVTLRHVPRPTQFQLSWSFLPYVRCRGHPCWGTLHPLCGKNHFEHWLCGVPRTFSRRWKRAAFALQPSISYRVCRSLASNACEVSFVQQSNARHGPDATKEFKPHLFVHDCLCGSAAATSQRKVPNTPNIVWMLLSCSMWFSDTLVSLLLSVSLVGSFTFLVTFVPQNWPT